MRSRASLTRASDRVRRAAGLLALLLVVVVTAHGEAAPASATTAAAVYHLSPTGNDSADGLSPGTAWRSLARANRQRFLPGESLLLQGGAVFPGMLHLDAADAGDAAAPVVVRSYGTGRAQIRSAGTPGVYVHNTAGLVLRDLVLTGDAASYSAKGGISLYNDLPGARRLAGVTIAGIEVSGYRNGVEMGAPAGSQGFRAVRVEDALLHDNMEAGLLTYGPDFVQAAPTYAHADVTVARVRAWRNVGDPGNRVRNTGNGIVLGSVSGGLVEWSTAHDNGSACVAPEGPAGIWTYDSERVVIQHNVSHHNRTGGGADGDGFDLDQNVSSSTLQHNLSYANDGAGYLIWTAKPAGSHRDNTVRFNISSDDGRKIAWYGGITISGAMSGTGVHHNTVVTSASPGGTPPALRLDTGLSGLTVRNNVFVVSGGGPVVAAPSLAPSSVLLQGNAYHSVGATPRFLWGATHTGLAAWRTSTGVETLDGVPTGLSGDPQLQDPRTPTHVLDPTAHADGFRLAAGSSLRGRGLDLPRRFGVALGATDHFGTPLAPDAALLDVGAHVPSAATAPTPVPSANPSPSPSPTPSPTPTASPSPSSAPTASPSPTVVPTTAPTPTPTATTAASDVRLGPATTVAPGQVRQHGSTGAGGSSSVTIATSGGTLRATVTSDSTTALTVSVRTSTGALVQLRQGASPLELTPTVLAGTLTVTVIGPVETPFDLVVLVPAL